jgi:NADH-quinone oxidoreductase subunit C
MLSDLTAIDWLGQTPRFEVVWHLYGTDHHRRLRIKTRVTEADPTVDSLVGIHGAARFMERECHDMYGIRFRGNEDLRPILLYEGFEGHPLRKDYPIDREQPLVALRE